MYEEIDVDFLSPDRFLEQYLKKKKQVMAEYRTEFHFLIFRDV